MFQIKIHKHIERITELFTRVGFWHREDEATVAERWLKLFFSIYFCFYLISLIAGALESDNQDEKIFLAQMSIISAVSLVKLLHIIWRKSGILERLHRICNYDVEDQKKFTEISDKLNLLMKFVGVFFSVVCSCAVCVVLVVPFLGTRKQLFFNIGFPLDYKNNDFAYWTAFVFLCTQMTIISISAFLNAIIWYLMANCGLRYVALGQQIKDMGKIRSVDEAAIELQISNTKRDDRGDNLYLRNLLAALASHQCLMRLTNQLDSFFSKLFAVQLTTSSLCICASIYCLAFSPGENLIENIIHLIFLLYNVFDIFMIMYFGNELQLASYSLSYSLFESNWMDRSQSIKKNVLIFGEFLMKPRKLVVLKLYPLTLATFTTILNAAYSMFNILLKLN